MWQLHREPSKGYTGRLSMKAHSPALLPASLPLLLPFLCLFLLLFSSLLLSYPFPLSLPSLLSFHLLITIMCSSVWNFLQDDCSGANKEQMSVDDDNREGNPHSTLPTWEAICGWRQGHENRSCRPPGGVHKGSGQDFLNSLWVSILNSPRNAFLYSTYLSALTSWRLQ